MTLAFVFHLENCHIYKIILTYEIKMHGYDLMLIWRRSIKRVSKKTIFSYILNACGFRVFLGNKIKYLKYVLNNFEAYNRFHIGGKKSLIDEKFNACHWTNTLQKVTLTVPKERKTIDCIHPMERVQYTDSCNIFSHLIILVYVL